VAGGFTGAQSNGDLARLGRKSIEVEDEHRRGETAKFADEAGGFDQWRCVDVKAAALEGSGLFVDIYVPGDELDGLHAVCKELRRVRARTRRNFDEESMP